MQPHSSTPDSEALHSTAFEVAVLSWRALWGVVGLVVFTVGALGLAWLLPDLTLLHFLCVAQAVPVLYLILAWWGIQTPHPMDDAS